MTLEELEQMQHAALDAAAQFEHGLRACTAASCASLGADQLKAALTEEAKKQADTHKCVVRGVGCLGLCALGPLVAVDERGEQKALYQNVQPADAPEIVEHVGQAAVERLSSPLDLPFLTRQQRVVLETVGPIDPEKLEE